MKDHIYLIGPNVGGVCKIGKTINPTSRFKAIQVDNWQDLKMLGLVQLEKQAGYQFELALHKRFRALQVKGEWFRDLHGQVSSAFRNPDFGMDVLAKWSAPKTLRKVPRTAFEKYLFENNIKQADFAKMHDMSVVTIHQYASGKVTPGMQRRVEIAKATDFGVPTASWLSPDRPRPADQSGEAAA